MRIEPGGGRYEPDRYAAVKLPLLALMGVGILRWRGMPWPWRA